MTVRELLVEGRSKLNSTGSVLCSIDNPSLDAAILLAEVLDCTREKLTANGTETVSSQSCLRFSELLDRRLSGECIAYILGRKEFMELEFSIDTSVLVPRPETEILVEEALSTGDAFGLLKKNSPKTLDLCTGSGAIAVSLKYLRPEWEIYASDISIAALETARANTEKLLSVNKNLIFYESDLFANINNKFDIIVSNPPYIPSGEMASLAPEVRREPLLALDGGKDGLDIIRKIITDALCRLNAGGCLLLEADPRQMKEINSLLEANGYENIQVKNDLAGNARIITAVKIDC